MCRASHGAVWKAPEITFTPSLKTPWTVLMSVLYFWELAHNWQPYDRTGRQMALNTSLQFAIDRPQCALPRTCSALSDARALLHMVSTCGVQSIFWLMKKPRYRMVALGKTL